MPGGHLALVVAAVAGLVGVLSTGHVVWTRDAGRRAQPEVARGRRLPAGRPDRPWARMAQIGSWLSLALVATAIANLLLLLAAGDFSVRYVWQHSAGYEGTLRRLSALLAGSEGSFLLWALLAAVAAGWTARRMRGRGDDQRPGSATVHLVVASVAVAVLLLTIASAPFQSFAEAFPALGADARPLEGRGLNPVLANPWMSVHTLLTFAGYALLGVAFAIGAYQLLCAARGKSGEADPWRVPGLRVARWAWLLISASLLTGIIWAYEEMSFGWFWSWDPVESATLVIWLLLTAALHAAGESGGGRRRLVYAPLLLTLSFLGVVFASFVTRSGLHPGSAHAFASGLVGRYLGVGLGLLLVAVATLAVVGGRRISATAPQRPWMFWAVWPLLAGVGVIVLGLVYPMVVTGLLGRTAEMSTGFFTRWGYLMAVGLLLLMGFGLQAAGGRRWEAARMLGLFGAITVLAALVAPLPILELMSAEQRAMAGGLEAFLGRASVLSLLPPAVYALMAVAERWWSGRHESSAQARLGSAGAALVHAGSVAIILGATFATALSSVVTVLVSPSTGIGAAEGVTVRITDVQRDQRFDGTGVLIVEHETAALEVWTSARIATGSATVSTYPERSMGRHAQVMISRGPLGDVQVIYHGIGDLRDDGVPVTVRRIPLINLLWAGLMLLVAGMAMIVGVRPEHMQHPPAPLRARRRGGQTRDLSSPGPPVSLARQR